MSIVRAHQDEPLDALCYRTIGYTTGVVEQTLALNLGLAEYGPLLPQGTPVELPEDPSTQDEKPLIQLWD